MRSMPDSTYDQAAHENEAAEQAAIEAALVAPDTDVSRSAAPEGAATVDGKEVTPEEVAASANRPGPNLVPDEDVVEVEAEDVVVEVALVEDSPVDEVRVGVPGLDSDADYVTVVDDVIVDEREEEVAVESAVVVVTSSAVELPAAVGELVAETPYVEVVG